jgi:hypothetical protein
MKSKMSTDKVTSDVSKDISVKRLESQINQKSLKVALNTIPLSFAENVLSSGDIRFYFLYSVVPSLWVVVIRK